MTAIFNLDPFVVVYVCVCAVEKMKRAKTQTVSIFLKNGSIFYLIPPHSLCLASRLDYDSY